MKKAVKKIFSLLLTVILIVSAAVALNVGKNLFVDTSAELSDVPPAKITDIGSPYKFYFDDLENVEKEAYNRILKKIYDMPERIRVPFITLEQLDKVFTAILCDNPDLFFVARRCTITTKITGTYCKVDYILTPEEYAAQRAQLDEVCAQVLKTVVGIDDPWKKELKIHDYIVENCKYNLVEGDLTYSSAYGALVNGEAACEGYAKAAKFLFDAAGIESGVVSGTVADPNGNPGSHMWNVVKIGGNFYHLDCTWNDPLSDTGEQMKLYAYFNLSDEEMSKTHKDFSREYGCNSMEENYFVKTDSYFDSFSKSDENRLSRIVANVLNGGEKDVQLRFGSKSAYDSAVNHLITNGRIYDVLVSAKNKTSAVFSTDSLTYYKDREQCVLNFTVDVTGRAELTNG